MRNRYFILDYTNNTLKQIHTGDPIPFTYSKDKAIEKSLEYVKEGLDIEVKIFKNITEAKHFIDPEYKDDFSTAGLRVIRRY